MSRRGRKRKNPPARKPPVEARDIGQAGAPESLLVARGVRKVYRSGEAEVPALAGVDFEVERGSFVSIMGPSGSGKTSLLQCLSGLDDVDAGTVTVAGEDVHRRPEALRAAQRARLMGFGSVSLWNDTPSLQVGAIDK